MPIQNWRVTFADGAHVDVVALTELDAHLAGLVRRTRELELTVSAVSRPPTQAIELAIRVVTVERV